MESTTTNLFRFPSISNKMADLVWNLDKYHSQTRPDDVSTTHVSPLGTASLIGTVKLHGTHGDILIHANNTISLQSRNVANLLPGETDNLGFAAFALASSRTPALLALKERYHSAFRTLNPDTPIDASYPLVLAGEWIGPGIQKGVAICSLPARVFVICCVSINNVWLPTNEEDGPYADISAEQDGIYNISRGGFYHHTLSLADTASSVQTLQALATSIEACCPFAKSLGIDGEGEGLVFRIASASTSTSTLPFPQDPAFWLKVKGPKHAVRGTPKAPKTDSAGAAGSTAEAKEKAKEKAATIAEEVTSENRLEQGWDFLRETRVERSLKGLGRFLVWVVADVEKEERRQIEAEAEAEGEMIEWKVVRKEVEGRARRWYISKVRRSEEEKSEGERSRAKQSRPEDSSLIR